MRTIVIYLALLGGLLFSSLQLSASTLERAELAYSEGRYRESSEYYLERITDKGIKGANGSIYHNLGLAFDRQKQLGLAVAAYLRAVQLEPRQGDFRYNLQFLLSQAKDKLDYSIPGEWYDELWALPASPFSEKEIYYLALTLLLFFSIFMCWSILDPARRRLALGFGSVVSFLFCLSVLGLTYKLFGEKSLGAVSVPKIKVYSGPTEAVVIFELHEGAPFQVIHINGDWVKIQISDQKQGWVKREGVTSFGRKELVFSQALLHQES